MKILNSVEQVNEEQKKSLLPKVRSLLPDLNNKRVAVWGLAFKPKTDDMREAPSLIVIKQLQEQGAKIVAFDPEAKETSRKHFEDLEYVDDPYKALQGADCLVLLTEWNTFRSLDKNRIKSLMRTPNIIDGRNVYSPSEMKKLGFSYIGVGRSN